MNSTVSPCFPKLILTKFARSFKSSIVSIILNHPANLLLQNADKNAYEKIPILRKHCRWLCCNFINITLLRVCLFFSFWVFFLEHSRFTELQGKEKAISLTPLYYLHPLHRIEPLVFEWNPANKLRNNYVIFRYVLVTNKRN